MYVLKTKVQPFTNCKFIITQIKHCTYVTSITMLLFYNAAIWAWLIWLRHFGASHFGASLFSNGH